ncbi:MAG: NfeD family protein [Bacillales bacterium]|nr:NfeD family protein [Mollicutes bacterium]MCI7212880.1 NfeD family protein [Bacillales bacterium]MDD7715428.1 NfeD family protein [Mollicutes bacterium]MDY4936470.1 NfeD family protein [Candidatus Enteromonas sp.]
MEEWMWLVWLIFAVAALIIEASTEAIVSIWFCVGALISFAISFIPGVPYWGEIIIFVGVSLISFFLMRPFIKKWTAKKEKTRGYIDNLVGKKGIVLTKVDSLQPGEIEVNGMTWTASTLTNETFEEGEVARVVSVAGNKLFIDKSKKE